MAMAKCVRLLPQECADLPPGPRTDNNAEQSENSPFVYSFSDLFAWAVLMRRQQMALFLWQHGEEVMAKAVVACKLYRSMAHEARVMNMGDNTEEELKNYSLSVPSVDGATMGMDNSYYIVLFIFIIIVIHYSFYYLCITEPNVITILLLLSY